MIPLSVASEARAYQTASTVSDDCHESITFSANAAVRAELSLDAAEKAGRDEQALIDDAPFPIPSGQRDLAAVTLALGNRDVDLKGNEPDDLDQLAQVHGNPDHQEEHCLRTPDDDGPDGSQKALERCREFIESRIEAAEDGLAEDGRPDLGRRTEVDVFLDLRGVTSVDLPAFYLEMGRALHTLQDAFSHHYRTDDDLSTTAVMNYVETIGGSFDESVDGPPHSSRMDECEALDEFRRDRLDVAVQASEDLLIAVLGTADADERETRVDGVLDRYLAYSPGCTADDDWCSAREHAYGDAQGCLCRSGPGGNESSGAPALWSLLSVGIWQLRGARRRQRRRRMSMVAGGVLVAGLLRPDAARAQEAGSVGASTDGGELAMPPDTTPDSTDREDPYPFGVYVAGAGAVQNTALAASVGLRYRLSDLWLLGVDVEYNPFIVRRTGDIRPGVGNAYATVVKRWPMKFERANLRTTLHAGASRMMFDLYGAPEGSIGPYFGFNLLGLDIELGRSLYLVIDPADIAIPIPQTEGVPFVYPQYRFTLGLQIGA